MLRRVRQQIQVLLADLVEVSSALNYRVLRRNQGVTVDVVRAIDHSIATASLDGEVPVDADLSVDIRGTAAAATVVPLPFYRRPKGA